MKYVAFLDVLGFKDKLKKLSQNDAKNYIGDFSSTIYSLFQNINNKINGYIVSDSVILYSNDVASESLKGLVTLVIDICKEEFTQNGILIRGAISKGEFDKMPAIELPKLQKQLIVGQAYVDAYLLEDSMKSIGISLSKEVYQDIVGLNLDVNCYDESSKKEEKFVLSYFDFEFINKSENLLKFVDLAIGSNWRPHYYNALYLAIKDTKNNNQIYHLFDQLIACIGNPSECWMEIDKFIKNTFNDDVISYYQTRFLGYIRERMQTSENKTLYIEKRSSNRDKILQYLRNNPYASIHSISDALNISVKATQNYIKKLIDEKQVLVNEVRVIYNDTQRNTKTYSLAEFDNSL